MKLQDGITIRTMTEQDLELAAAWAAAEGWNPGIRDAVCFHAADPEGFFMAYQGDRPAGSISAVAYDGSFGFMGFYIVRPGLRGQGIGMALWKAAMDHMGERNVGGDGVVAMQVQEIGFLHRPQKHPLPGDRSRCHRLCRYRGHLAGTVPGAAPLRPVPLPRAPAGVPGTLDRSARRGQPRPAP